MATFHNCCVDDKEDDLLVANPNHAPSPSLSLSDSDFESATEAEEDSEDEYEEPRKCSDPPEGHVTNLAAALESSSLDQ